MVVTTGGWLPLPFLVAGTDLVAAIPERLARRVCPRGRAPRITEPPFAAIELVEAAWWHPMRATDPALTWLRTTLREEPPGSARPRATRGTRGSGALRWPVTGHCPATATWLAGGWAG